MYTERRYTLLAALLPLIGILPSMSTGVINNADGPLHVHRIFAMSTLLSEGNLYPRWISWFHLGFGYPVFNYYPPGVFYLGGILGQFGITPAIAFNLIAAFAWIIGTVGMYQLARRFIPPHAALLAAALWAYAPSRLFEVWNQGSLPQMFAAACVTWLFVGITDLTRRPHRNGIIITALSLAGVILTHQPITFITALYVVPLIVIRLTVIAFRNHERLKQTALYIGAGLLLAAGLAAVFLVPLALELPYIQAADGASDNINYLISNFLHPNEIFAQPQPFDMTDLRTELPTTFGFISAFFALIGFITLIVKKRYQLAIILGCGIVFTLYMLIESSLPVWLAIPYFRQLRFPERFLRVGVILLSLAGGASLLIVPPRWQKIALYAALALVVIATLPILTPDKTFIYWENQSAQDEIEFELATAAWGTTSYDEFDPIWGDQIPYTPAPEIEEYATDPLRLVVSRVDMATYGDIMHVAQLDTTTSRITIENLADGETHPVRFHQYYFPGWQATVDDEPVEIYPDQRFGLITLDLPNGAHTVKLAYIGTPAQHIGAIITVISIAILLFLIITPVPRTAPPADLTPLSAQHMGIIAVAIIGFALINTHLITPHRPLFSNQSPPDQPVAMQTPVHAVFDETFELLGYTLNQEVIAQNLPLKIDLFWRALRPTDRDYHPVVQIVSYDVSEAWAISQPLFAGGGHVSQDYPVERFASETHKLRINDNAPPYVGKILIQMVETATGEPLPLANGQTSIVLEPIIRVLGSDAPVTPHNPVNFADAITLTCANITDDDAMTLRLFWHVDHTPPADFVTFVHALNADGNIISQADTPPLAGAYPPHLWQRGQSLTDSYTITRDPAIAQIAIGLYYPSGERLTAHQNGQPLQDNRLLIPMDTEPCQ